MRLLLDEMLTPAIAEQLVAEGCNTTAISAHPELRGAPDTDVLELAAQQDRILVTDNIQDFAPLSNHCAAQGKTHPGIVMISSKTFPMSVDRSGRIAAALIERHHARTWPHPGQYDFLQPKRA